MRATVARCFCDKERSESFYGEGMEYEGSDARVRELTELGYLEPRGPEPEPADPDPGPAPAAGARPDGPEEQAAEGQKPEPKPAPKAAPAKKPAQKKAAPKAAPKKVSQGGGLRDKI